LWQKQGYSGIVVICESEPNKAFFVVEGFLAQFQVLSDVSFCEVRQSLSSSSPSEYVFGIGFLTLQFV
jgi:hypothetical protein